MRRAAVVAFALVALFAAGVQAQGVQEFYLTLDEQGQRVYRIVQPDTFPKNVPENARVVYKGKATWNLTFQDVINSNGIGFNQGGGVGTTRQATANAVAAYLDSILNESGTCNVHFAVSETDGGGALAAAGPSGSCTDGCQNGYAYENLKGSDPNPGSPEMNITVDFGYTWNSDMGAPAGGEYDLFSVLLHEMGHGIGLTSFTISDGTSFGPLVCEPDATFYSGYDNFIHRTSGGVDLYTCGPPATFNGVAGDMTGGGLDWRGPNAVASYGGNPEVYAPNPWDDGSSIAHWDPTADANALMQPSIGAGVQRRQLRPWEIQALIDIGYDAVPVELMRLSVE